MPRLSENEAILLACLANSWSVQDWGHFLYVVRHETVEEFLVSVLQAIQVDVLLKRFIPVAHIGKYSSYLLVLGEDDWGQQAMDSHDLPLLQGEGCSLKAVKNTFTCRNIIASFMLFPINIIK